MKNFYRRNLPHWHPINQSFFLTWCLYGSLPKRVIADIKLSLRQLVRSLSKLTRAGERVREYKRQLVKIDRILDKAETGPVWLANPEIAESVQNALLEVYSHLYKLWSYVVMSNHVHVLLKPKPGYDVELITKHVKG